ncbi:MAG: hypothetical protein JNM00_11255, partial [Flavobacteriales bacterium]|nr:hypothetical protein [Flavobacteriales bacterium]
YLENLYFRKKKEVDEYFALTGKVDTKGMAYINEYVGQMKVKPEGFQRQDTGLPPMPGNDNTPKGPGPMLIVLGLLALTSILLLKKPSVSPA